MTTIKRPEFIAATLAGRPNVCPVCGNDDERDGDMDGWDARTVTYNYSCECGADWCAVYRMVGVLVRVHESDNPTDEMDAWVEFPVADDQRMPEPATAASMAPDTLVRWTIGNPETANGERGEWGVCPWSEWAAANGDDPEFVAEVEACLLSGPAYGYLGGGGAAPEIRVTLEPVR